MTYEEKKTAFYDKMKEYTRQDICIAFSGGVDSSLLLMAAQKSMEENRKIYAVTFDTMLHPACDLENAKKVAEEAGVAHKILFLNELEQADIRFNPVNRCYLCKKALFQRLKEFADSKGISLILEGTNEDDLHVYRPGRRALEEYGVESPLARCGVTKQEVRELAAAYGISAASRPSTPCMATRLPYGSWLSYELLDRIAEGEEWLRNRLGVQTNIRLRVHQDIARIETDEKAMPELLKWREEAVQKLQKLGFSYVTLDLEGFRSGSMDRKIGKEKEQE